MTKEQNEFITKLVDEHGERLAQMAYRYTGDAHLAEDIVQETMLTACCKVDILTSHENVKGWLRKTLWNLATREMSKAYHGEISMEPDLVEGSSGIDLPMDLYLPKGLNDKEREIILLRIDKGLSYAELAEVKGMTESACRQQLSRAIRKCRELMLKSEEENATPV